MSIIQIAETLPTAALPDALQTRLENAAIVALEHTNTPGTSELSIVITDDSQLQALSRQFLGIDSPTDVLSFPAEERDPDTGRAYLGDILISLPRAQAQAEAAGHSLEAELCLLTVHGILHLIGHDHAEEGQKAIMWSLQAQILEKLGVSPPLFPER